MANYNRNRKSYGGKNNKQQQKPTSFACPRKFYSLCSHRLGEGVGLVGIFVLYLVLFPLYFTFLS